jgi:hypothetical protein
VGSIDRYLIKSILTHSVHVFKTAQSDDQLMEIKKNIAISDTGFVFNPNNGDSFTLNPIGLEIVRLVQEGKGDQEIVDHITENYSIDSATVEKDVYDFKKSLIRYKLGHEKAD